MRHKHTLHKIGIWTEKKKNFFTVCRLPTIAVGCDCDAAWKQKQVKHHLKTYHPLSKQKKTAQKLPYQHSSKSAHPHRWSQHVWCSSRNSPPISKYQQKYTPKRPPKTTKPPNPPYTATIPNKNHNHYNTPLHFHPTNLLQQIMNFIHRQYGFLFTLFQGLLGLSQRPFVDRCGECALYSVLYVLIQFFCVCVNQLKVCVYVCVFTWTVWGLGFAHSMASRRRQRLST